MELKIPPPVYMLLFATLMWLLSQYLPIYRFPWDGHVIAYLFFVIGATLDFSSLVKFLLSKTSINPLKPDSAKNLVTGGMYRLTRNPMYLGLLSILTGWSFYLGSLSSFLLLPVFVWVITKMQIIPEEKILQNIFKQEYTDYKKRVKRWL